MEVAGDGIHVVLIQPGGFTTAIWDGNEQAIARHTDSRFAGAYEREMRLTQLAQPFMGDPRQVATAQTTTAPAHVSGDGQGRQVAR